MKKREEKIKSREYNYFFLISTTIRWDYQGHVRLNQGLRLVHFSNKLLINWRKYQENERERCFGHQRDKRELEDGKAKSFYALAWFQPLDKNTKAMKCWD